MLSPISRSPLPLANERGVSVGDFPRLAAETDDTGRIQRAINALTVPGMVYFPPSGTYKISSALTVDPHIHSLISHGATIDGTGMANGYMLNFVSTTTPPYGNATTRIDGLKFNGPGLGSTVDAIHLGSANANSTSHITFRNIAVSNVRYGVVYDNHSYLHVFENSDFWNCSTILYEASGFNDYGEREVFTKCAFFNSNLVLNLANGSADFYFDGCSFDYNTQCFNLTGGYVRVSNSHIEFNSDTMNHFSVTGSTLQISKSNIVYSGSAGSYPIINAASMNNHGISLRDIFISNTPTNRLVTTDGSGHVVIDNVTGFGYDTPFVPSNAIGILADPSFEGANAAQQFTPTTGGAGTVTIDATTAHTGTHSIKLYKPATTDTASLQMFIPIRPGQRAFVDFFYNLSNVVVGTGGANNAFFIRASYLDANKNELSGGEFYDSGTVAWKNVNLTYFRDNYTPPGAAYIRIWLALYGTATGTAWVDDVYVNIC